MHQMQAIEQQAAEWRMAGAEACAATGDAGERGGVRHEAGEAGELAHAVVLGYNWDCAGSMDTRPPALQSASSEGAR